MPKIQDEFIEQYTMTDKYGAHYSLRRNFHTSNYQIKIKLKGESSYKLIAEVDTKHSAMIMTRIKEKHFLRKMVAYGFNWTLVNKILPIPIVAIVLVEHDAGDTCHYVIPLKDIRDKGYKTCFSTAGYELQWVFPYVTLMEYRVNHVVYKGGVLYVNETALHQNN